MMEIERLKALQEMGSKVEKRKGVVYQGCAMIVDQIKEREFERLRQEEILEKERMQMLKNIEQQKEAELRALVEKKERVKRLQEEAAASNKAAITAKEEARRREKALEQEIVEFQKRRDAKEAEFLAEKAREREEREREIQRLREQQEKASDRQAELDAIKAKKVQEQHELKVRAAD